MVSSQISEEFSDWEEITDTYGHRPPSPPPDVQHFGYELVIRDDFYDDGFSVFPPSEHEDLPLLPEGSKPTEDNTSASSAPFSDTELPEQQQHKSDSKVIVKMNEIRVGIFAAGRRGLKVFASRFRYQIFSSRLCTSVIPAAALAIALFACMKILQWRNKFLLVTREKDQRISQLLNQIAHMNEILSARRKVPVLRIN